MRREEGGLDHSRRWVIIVSLPHLRIDREQEKISLVSYCEV